MDTPSYWEHKPDGLLPYGDPNSAFRSSKTSPPASGLPLLPPPQAHNGVYPIYNVVPSSGHAQRNYYKDSDQGIHRSRPHRPTIFYGIWQRSANDNYTCFNISTFSQDRTELLNNHHRLGHVSIKVAKGIVIFRTLSLYSLSNKSISSLSFSCGHDPRHAL